MEVHMPTFWLIVMQHCQSKVIVFTFKKSNLTWYNYLYFLPRNKEFSLLSSVFILNLNISLCTYSIYKPKRNAAYNSIFFQWTLLSS
jgi:hypothetical protein